MLAIRTSAGEERKTSNNYYSTYQKLNRTYGMWNMGNGPINHIMSKEWNEFSILHGDMFHMFASFQTLFHFSSADLVQMNWILRFFFALCAKIFHPFVIYVIQHTLLHATKSTRKQKWKSFSINQSTMRCFCFGFDVCFR